MYAVWGWMYWHQEACLLRKSDMEWKSSLDFLKSLLYTVKVHDNLDADFMQKENRRTRQEGIEYDIITAV